MKMFKRSFKLAAALLFALGIFTGKSADREGMAMESADIEGTQGAITEGAITKGVSRDGEGTDNTTIVYYGDGFNDPWYHGDEHYDYDVVVTPPDRPGSGARPEHPIARPPGSSSRPPGVSTRPAPSIPSTPRPAPRGGGGRR